MKNILFGGEINFSFPRDLDGDLERREKVKILENLSLALDRANFFFEILFLASKTRYTHIHTHIRSFLDREKKREKLAQQADEEEKKIKRRQELERTNRNYFSNFIRAFVTSDNFRPCQSSRRKEKKRKK